MNRNVLAGLAAAAVLVAGCTMAPSYERPDAPIPVAWPRGPAYEQAPAEGPAGAELGWREFFADPRLQQVLEMALEGNRDLRAAALNVELARARYGIQRAELLPALQATAGGGKQRASADLTQPGQPRTTERYEANLGVLSWEIDFFGRIRSLKDAALEEYLATEEARRSAQVLLVSAVASTYLALAADAEALALARSTYETQTAAYDLVRRQYEVGVATELDLHRAQTPVDVARREVAVDTQRVAEDRNALHLLVGGPVPAALLPEALSTVGPLRDVSPGTSSEVLLRRPDVRQAEGLLKAAHADMGAALAAFFPRISLTGAVGTASDELCRLFKNGTGTWSYAPQIVLPIFDARTWSAHEGAKVQREIALNRYEQAIQSAFREVADALAVRGTVDQQVAAQQSLVAALAETHRLARLRFERGIDSYLSVLDAQRSLFAAQQVLIALRLARLLSQVRLYTVAGGGWQ
ncbi:MAG: efflux transporter outer membrane subunit [Planctomycetes bacterium]|nr:efflux transporter outer membrane subunit [Planctomycetota bacterium]